MSDYAVTLSWSLGDGQLEQGQYNVNHRMRFSGGLEATMTSAPDWGGDARFACKKTKISGMFEIYRESPKTHR